MTPKYFHFNPTPFESHMLVFGRIKEGSKVLDVGCSGGYFARELKKKNCRVWGIEIDRKAAEQAEKYCEKVVAGDVKRFASSHLAGGMIFDYILFLDVLEHLKDPEKVLKSFIPYLNKKGKIIISVPNVAFISIRLALLRGKFNYRNQGILDENHLHFFTKKTLLKLIKDSNLRLEEFDAASGFSQITLIGKYLNYIPKLWQYRITEIFDTLLAYQFVAVCRRQYLR